MASQYRGSRAFKTVCYSKGFTRWQHATKAWKRLRKAVEVAMAFGQSLQKSHLEQYQKAFLLMLQRRVVDRANLSLVQVPGQRSKCKRHLVRWRRWLELRLHWRAKLKLQNEMKKRAESMPGFMQRGEVYFASSAKSGVDPEAAAEADGQSHSGTEKLPEVSTEPAPTTMTVSSLD